MRDQAAALRLRASLVPARAPSRPAPAAFAIGSGKGGVGKSALSVLLAAALARHGQRVLLFDAAHNQGNLHVLLGVRPLGRLDALIAGEITPRELLVPVAERLTLLPGDSGAESLYGMSAVDRARLHQRLSGLYDDFDAVIVDAGPGIETVVRATIRASRLVVVAAPEPAALSDAYALIKIVNHQIPSLGVDVIVNRVTNDEECHAAFGRLALAASRFLKRELRCLGALSEQPEIARRVREPGTLLAFSSPEIDVLAARLMAGATATTTLAEAA